MAEVDKLLIGRFSGNYAEPEGKSDLHLTPENIATVKSGEIYKETGINYEPHRLPELWQSSWDTNHWEIFQVRTFFYLIEQACKSYNGRPLTMVELGSGNGYYSGCFHDIVTAFGKECVNICTEPIPHKVDEIIKRVPTAKVYHGYTGTWNEKDGDLEVITSTGDIEYTDLINAVEQYTIEDLITKSDVEKIDFLHVDIQGGEVDVIKEIKDKDLFDKVHWYFISTHAHLDPESHSFVRDVLATSATVRVDIEGPAVGWADGDGFILAENTTFEGQGGQVTDIPEKYTRYSRQFKDIYG